MRHVRPSFLLRTVPIILICAALSAVPVTAWAQAQPTFDVHAKASDGGSLVVVIDINTPAPVHNDATVTIAGPPGFNVILEQVPIRDAGLYSFATRELDPGAYEVHVRYNEEDVRIQVSVAPPEPEPATAPDAEPPMPPPGPPATEHDAVPAEPPAKVKYDDALPSKVELALIIIGIIFIGICVTAYVYSRKPHKPGADGGPSTGPEKTVVAASTKQADVTQDAMSWMGGAPHKRTDPVTGPSVPSQPSADPGHPPDNGAPPAPVQTPQPASRQAAGPPGATKAAALPAAPGVKEEKRRMRELLGDGTIVIDTNMCINHFLYKASKSGTLDSNARTTFANEPKHQADDTVQGLVEDAVSDGRARFSKEIRHEINTVLDKVVTANPNLGRGMTAIKKLDLYKIYGDNRYILGTPSDDDIAHIKQMYDGFLAEPETKGIMRSLNRRKRKNRTNDMRILASAMGLARSVKHVRLLTLDSDFTELVPHIRERTGVDVVDGSPYMRIGRMLHGRRNYLLAEEYVEYAVGLKSDDDSAHLLAVVLYKRRKIERSRDVGQRVGRDRKSAKSIFRKADLCLMWGDYDMAVKECDAALLLVDDKWLTDNKREIMRKRARAMEKSGKTPGNAPDAARRQ